MALFVAIPFMACSHGILFYLPNFSNFKSTYGDPIYPLRDIAFVSLYYPITYHAIDPVLLKALVVMISRL